MARLFDLLVWLEYVAMIIFRIGDLLSSWGYFSMVDGLWDLRKFDFKL